MIKNILLIDVEHDRAKNSRSQLQTRWSHHPIGLMYIATAVEKVFKDIKFERYIDDTPDLFSEDKTITNITIPDTVTQIGERAFSGCTSLTNIIINSDNEDDIARITALWPPYIHPNIQSKVVNKQAYEIAQGICQSALCRVTSEPVTTKAYHLYHAYPDLNDDIILKIGSVPLLHL